MASGFNDTSTGKITFAEMMKEYKIPASKNDVDEVKHFQPDRALKPTKSRQFYSKQDLPQSLICEQIQRMCVISVEQTPVQSSENPVDQLPDLIIDGDRVILLSDKYFKYTEEAVKDTKLALGQDDLSYSSLFDTAETPARSSPTKEIPVSAPKKKPTNTALYALSQRLNQRMLDNKKVADEEARANMYRKCYRAPGTTVAERLLKQFPNVNYDE